MSKKQFKTDAQRKAAMANMKSGPKAKGKGAGGKAKPATKAPAKAPEKPKYTLEQLQRYHSNKSLQRRVMDDTDDNKDTFTHHENLAVEIWFRNGGAADIIGVDDPDAEFRAANAAKDAPRDFMDRDLVVIPIKGGRGQSRTMTEEKKEARRINIERVDKAIEDSQKEVAVMHEGKPKERVETRLKNLNRLKKAYASGEYLVVAQAKDEKMAKLHAKTIKERFEVNPRSMDSAFVLVGKTGHPSAYGYTHPMPAYGGAKGDFIALNEKAFTAKKGDVKGNLKEDPADTLTHEQIHVMRLRESGRTKPETRGLKERYGMDRDAEEKYTVLEEQLRSAPPGTKKGVAYYSLIDGPDIPDHVGAADNRIARGNAAEAKKVKSLKEVEKAMHENGTNTYIARLSRDRKSGKWGRVTAEQEGIDRVLESEDGDRMHVYNPRGSSANLSSLVDGIDGKKGDTIYEYVDGQRVPGAAAKPKMNKAEREAAVRARKRAIREKKAAEEAASPMLPNAPKGVKKGGKAVVKTGKAVADVPIAAAKATVKGTVKTGKEAVKTPINVTKQTGKATVKAGKAVVKVPVSATKATARGAVKATKATGKATVKAGKAVVSAPAGAVKAAKPGGKRKYKAGAGLRALAAGKL